MAKSPQKSKSSTSRSTKLRSRGYIVSRRQKLLISISIGLVVLLTGIYLFMSFAATPGAPIVGIGQKCIDNNRGKLAKKNKIQLWPCNNGAAQKWTMESNGSIRLGASTYCLDVMYGGRTSGTPVWLWRCTGSGAQKWQAKPNNTLVNPQSGRCLQPKGGSSATGTPLEIAKCSNATAQKWQLPQQTSEFPNASNTGWQPTNVTLTNCGPSNGFLTSSNVTYDSCYFPNGVVIIGANITIKRSHIHGVVQGHYTKDWDLQNLQLTDVEIEEASNMSPDRAAIEGARFNCLRCNVHHTGTGIHLGDNSSVTDSWMHDFIMTPGAHGAGIAGTNGNGDNSTIIHNNIECNRLEGQDQVCSAALALYSEPSITNVLVERNLFNTVGGYCTYGGGANGTNIRFIDNKYGKKYNSTCGTFGPSASYYQNNSGNQWQGNTWQDGSGVIGP